MQWEVNIWTHEGVQKEFIVEGTVTIDDLLKQASLKPEEVNGIEINPYGGNGNASQARK